MILKAYSLIKYFHSFFFNMPTQKTIGSKSNTIAVFKLYLHKTRVIGPTIFLGLSHSIIDAQPADDSKFTNNKRDRPNIPFICADDQAPWALGGASGNKQAITPHMDRLVSQSAYLVNSVVSRQLDKELLGKMRESNDHILNPGSLSGIPGSSSKLSAQER